MKLRLLFVLLIAVAVGILPGCGASETKTNTETPQPQVKPDPNTLFSSFATFFHEETLPFELAHSFPPGGTSLSEELQDRFLKRKVEAFPMFRFALTTGYRAFITAENKDGNFNYILNVYNEADEVTTHRMVAGKDAGMIIDAKFAADGSWTETRTPIAEDTGAPSGDPTVSNHTISSDGQVIDK